MLVPVVPGSPFSGCLDMGEVCELLVVLDVELVVEADEMAGMMAEDWTDIAPALPADARCGGGGSAIAVAGCCI